MKDINKLSLFESVSSTNVRKAEASYLSTQQRGNLEEFTLQLHAVWHSNREFWAFPRYSRQWKPTAYRDALLKTVKSTKNLNDTETEFTPKKKRIWWSAS